MFSRLSLTGGKSLRIRMFKFQPVSAINTSSTVSESAVKTNDPSKHPPEYPPPTSKRDFVNFPRPVLQETAPPVRLGFFPESWFNFMYPKTGYTGLYVLMGTQIIHLLSKEIVVWDHNFNHMLAFITACSVIHIKFGDIIGRAYSKLANRTAENLDRVQIEEQEALRENIKELEGQKEGKNAIQELTKGTTAVIQMQMEIAFRERLQEIYKKVKNQLDCQAELENVEKRVAQKNLMDYVTRHVMSSLTPELEKKAMQICVKDLNELAAKA